MAKPRNKFLDYLVYVGVRLFDALVHMFPVDLNYRTGAWMGNVLFALDRRHRKRAIEHLRRSFPDWTEERYREVARASMRSMVYLGLEVLFTTRLITPLTWRRHIELKNMAGPLRMLLEARRGMIMLTGHFGNWEVVGYTLATLGFPTVSIARRLDNPYLDQYVFGIRQRTGQTIIDKRGASSVAPDVLEQKGVVGFIADQDAGKKGSFVDFFGRKASTYKSIALIGHPVRGADRGRVRAADRRELPVRAGRRAGDPAVGVGRQRRPGDVDHARIHRRAGTDRPASAGAVPLGA